MERWVENNQGQTFEYPSALYMGIVIVDSPLTAYQKADHTEEDELTADIEAAFFEALSETPMDRQIIVLDNKSPNDQVIQHINYIHFTKIKGKGRYGLFPI